MNAQSSCAEGTIPYQEYNSCRQQAFSIVDPNMRNTQENLAPTFRHKLLVAIGTSALFMVVYGGTSWITSLRAPVPVIRFDWEDFIPFLPWMIIPYMSIDAFFFAAPFLTRTRDELNLFAKRISLAVLVAGICFLVYPLQLASERPVAEGWFGAIYNWFCGLDRPYNLCPSLHIALRTILASFYARHTAGWVRTLSHFWFSLIGFSTLTLYQHHVIDVAFGFVLAAACFYAFQPVTLRQPVVPNPAIGRLYLLPLLLCLLLTVFMWPWGIIWIWPAISLTLLVSAYFGNGPGLFRKAQGIIPLSAQIVMAPILIGQKFSLRYYALQCDAWNEVTDRVWIGRILSKKEAKVAIGQGITHVLDMTAEFSECKPFLQCHYQNLQVLDLTAPTPGQLKQAVTYIDQASQNGVIYIHCKIGYSRSAAVVCAWLLHSGRCRSVDEAVAFLRSKRAAVIVRPEVLKSLQFFAANLPCAE